MPPLTYPDQITYYGFCKTDNPYARKAFPHNPVDPAEVLRQANEIKAWVTTPESDIPFEDFDARAKELQESLAQRAIATGTITLGDHCVGGCSRASLSHLELVPWETPKPAAIARTVPRVKTCSRQSSGLFT